VPDIHALRRAAEYVTQRRGTSQERHPAGAKRPGQDCRIEGSASLLKRDGGRPLEIRNGFPIITLRLSPKELSFLANHELQPDDLVELKLPAKDAGEKIMKVRILEARRAGLSAFDIAAVFTSSS
jgi:hypothetical protein